MGTQELPDAWTVHTMNVRARWNTVTRAFAVVTGMDERMQTLLPADDTLETDAALDSTLRDALAVVEEARTALLDLVDSI